MNLSDYIQNLAELAPFLSKYQNPWDITDRAEEIVRALIKNLDDNFFIKDDVAIHKTAVVESFTTLKGPIIIGENSFVAAGAYLRGGSYIGKNVKIGPSSEVKASFIFDDTALAHFNYVGNSLVGARVNLEAGAIIAVHFNEREDKTIQVMVDGKPTSISSEKFGALVGDDTKIGANAVLFPGTVLRPKSIVGRLELVNQIPQA